MKKKFAVLMSATLLMSSMPLTFANANELPVENNHSQEIVIKEKHELIDNNSYQLTLENKSNELKEIEGEEKLNDLIKVEDEYHANASLNDTIKAITGITALIGSAAAGSYMGGKYVGQQLKVKYNVTPATYKKYRWVYKAAMNIVGGPLAAQGLDDYFYGI